MVLEKVLKVQAVKKAKIISELAQINQVSARETEQLNHLNGFLDEYTVEKTLEGRRIDKSELLNQNNFVGKIVGAQQLQHQKLNKIGTIRANKQTEFAQKKQYTDLLEEKLKIARSQQQKEIDDKEDAENTDLFNSRKKR